MTECTQEQFPFEAHFSRQVVGRFDGSRLTTDGGALLLRQTDRKIGLLKRLAHCFTDYRQPERIEHSLEEMLAQRAGGDDPAALTENRCRSAYHGAENPGALLERLSLETSVRGGVVRPALLNSHLRPTRCRGFEELGQPRPKWPSAAPQVLTAQPGNPLEPDSSSPDHRKLLISAPQPPVDAPLVRNPG